MSFEVGTRCWYPSEKEGWIGGEVTKYEVKDGKYHLELTLEDGSVVPIVTDSLVREGSDESGNQKLPQLRNPPILEATEDLTSLSYLNEPAVLHAIKQRYSQLNIYTYSGIVLIATNPFDRVDQLYSQDMIQAYAGKRRGELEPHLFAIAEEAYRMMKNDKKNQTIVVSGESGAGKTVSAKYIMRYFASVEEENSNAMDNVQHQVEMSETEQKILATNPIMEAFGNAKTTRNDNSSRFGKYLEILFDKNTSIIGARIRTYLLERSRLVYQPKIERNYHIFYQLLAGLPQEFKEELQLTNADDYLYMNQGGETQIAGVDDAQEYKTTVEALTLVGVNKATQSQVFKILAALLHIGNIEIKKTRNDASLSSDEPNLKIACELLGIDSYNFAKWITKKQINTRSEKIVSNLTYPQAVVARDSVAKFIYSALFDWLVENINTVLCNPEVSDQVQSFIGVLDIYGFEHFEKNSFEQFCINYANEKLQQEFNQHVFKLEQEEYVKEEIEWSFIEFNDNQPCIDLIENKLGILSLLDEESRLPAGSDESWTQKLYQTLDKPPTNQVFSKPRFGQTKFVVSHYAHDVAYDVEGFIEKNRDTVSDGHLEVLKDSKNETLQGIIKNLENAAARLEEAKKAQQEQNKKRPGPARTVQRKPTLGFMFKQSLIELMDTINSTNVHYIRCIKPNSEKEPWKFDNLMVLSQLRACGVLETIRISCAGFPSRWTFSEFVLRYYLLIPSNEWSQILGSKGPTEDSVVQICKMILDSTVTDKEKYQIGNTKIFFKAGMLAFFEKLRSEKIRNSSVLIQKNIRAKYQRKQYLAIQRSLHLIGACSLGLIVRRRTRDQFMTKAAIMVQAMFRGHRTRSRTLSVLDSVVRIQSLVRQRLSVKEMKAKQESNAAVTIQSRVRSFRPRNSFNRSRKSVVKVQALVRRRSAMTKLKALKSEAKSVNHLQEVSYQLENKVIELTQNLASKVKANKEMTARITELQAALAESANLQSIIEGQKREHSKALEKQAMAHDHVYKDLEDQRKEAELQMEQVKQEVQSMTEKYNKIKEESRAQLEELENTRNLLNDSKTQNSYLHDQVKTLKEEISRLQNHVASSATVYAQTPRSSKRYSMNGSDTMSPGQKNLISMNGPSTTVPVTGLGIENGTAISGGTGDNKSTMSTLSQINDELYRLLEDTKVLNEEVTEGLLKAFKVPDSGVAIQLSEREVLYPARILIIILSDMWRLGLTKQSEGFLAEVLTTIQKVVQGLKGADVIPGGAFWLTNVRELYSFVIFAQESILNDESYNKGLTEDEYKEYVVLVTELREDFESLSYNIYNIWLKKLQKDLQKKAVPAVILSESLPGFKNEPNRFLSNLFGSGPEYTMDDILTFFNSIYWCMKSFHVENEVFRDTVLILLNYVDAICFNDLIMRRNFLSWKRGLQLNYNVTRLEEWCKTHYIPEGADCLQHLVQTSKLLQLRKQDLDDIKLLCEICTALKPAQMQKLMSQYAVADYEAPISGEILNYVAEKVKKGASLSSDGKSKVHSDDIFLQTETGPFEDPYVGMETRQFRKIEAYIPAWLNLPTTRRVVELVTRQVSVQESNSLFDSTDKEENP
ncbi:probable Myosin-2 [Zygosaccharomyces bailii ISA1307]|nr:probable Myosin-2 [Zygosaccharomyces bailii ISA1307]